MLDLADVAAYLMQRNLVDARGVVDGGLRVVDVRLNRVFLVTAHHDRCFVVKLVAEAGSAGVAHEAAVLQRLRAADKGHGLAPFLPAVVAYDSAEGVLILEAACDAQDLARHHAHGLFSCVLAREVGRALALLHKIPPAALNGLPTPAEPMWALRLHRPELSAMRRLSAASVELVRTVQCSDELCAGLDDLLASSRVESVVHGDIRWSNCLALRHPSSKRRSRLLLIDWEMSGAGDPGLDIGAFFGEYLQAWLQSIPVANPRDPGRLLAHARFPLRRMQPALKSFWNAYTRHSAQPASELSRTLRRSTRFAAVRLLVAALEEAQTTAELRGHPIYTMQLSANILRRPDEAAAHLLGFSAPWASA